jgi:hypothetical protein
VGFDVKLLIQGALIGCALSVISGIFDGQQRPGFGLSADALQTHAHAGTLGWIMLSVVALSLLLFGGGGPNPLERWLAHGVSLLAVVSVMSYVLALLSGNALAAVATAALVLLAIVTFVVWLGMRSLQIQVGVAHLALLAATAALLFGVTVGVLLQVQAASARTLFAAGTTTVHPTVLTGGYLFLAGMAVIEWRLMPLTPLNSRQGYSTLGVAQVALPFLSAVALTASILLGIAGLAPLSLALEIGGMVLFLVRLREPLAHARWLVRGSERHYALATLFLVAYVGLFTYVLVSLVRGVYRSFDDVPPATLTAIDHTMFIGVMSNALFGAIQELTAAGRGIWAATEDVLFWGMNVGVAGFIFALLAHGAVVTPLLEGIFTPILGASLLVAIVAYSLRLHRTSARPAGVTPASRPSGG